MFDSVAYLGFRKGGKFSLATSAQIKEGANQVFQIFFNVKKKFWPKGGHGPMASVRIDGGLGGWTPHLNLQNPLF